MYKKAFFLFSLLGFSLFVSAQSPQPWQNPALPVEQRVDDLLGRLTLDEKVKLMMNGSPAIERLGIPQWNWWSEALHGVGRNGVATVFPSCIGMACSFDDALLDRIYTAVSDEARAKNTEQRRQGKPIGRYQSLSFWTPNINVFRDPRWGRGQETYGEDPYQNGRMGSIVVRALQGTNTNPDSKYLKLHACAKHYAVHSGPEKIRHSFDVEDLPVRDLWETYLPAFKTLVQKADVQQVMCAYQRFEGDPCCGSNRLLQQILRDEWGFKGLVVSDCGAVSDFWQEGRHGVSADAASASAKAVISGTDVECGSNYKNLPEAVKRGEISMTQIDTSMRRLLRGRFELGEFDPDSEVEWTKIPTSVIASKEHKALARQMGREQMVLLKNNGILPLKATSAKLMVMGPNAADSVQLWGIYFGQPSHSVTMLEGIQTRLGTNVPYLTACSITSMTVKEQAIGKTTETADGSTTLQMIDKGEHTYSISEILNAAKQAETIIFVGGISPNLEREEAKTCAPGFDRGDRTSIELPQVQRDILSALHKAGKKIVFVNCSGSAVALAPEMETCDAIVQAWYAGEQGGHALADVLFGDYNPSGKLAVTFYRDDSQLPPFKDYHMKGRTYRYFRGQPLFPFGFGLSYTTFSMDKEQCKKNKDGAFEVSVNVRNTGNREGTEVVQLYLRRPADVEGPAKTLRGYQRVSLKAGESKTVTITLPREDFEVWDATSNTMRVIPGDYQLMIGSSSDDKDLRKINVTL
jgi:beta-glucosidase